MTSWLRRLALALVLLGGLSAPLRPLVVSVDASSQKGTVHVKGYTKKDGTKVEPYDRKAPEKKSTKAEPAPPKAAKEPAEAKPPKTTKQPAVTTASAPRNSKGRIERSAAA